MIIDERDEKTVVDIGVPHRFADCLCPNAAGHRMKAYQ